jgi:hypothetical protein
VVLKIKPRSLKNLVVVSIKNGVEKGFNIPALRGTPRTCSCGKWGRKWRNCFLVFHLIPPMCMVNV